MVNLEYHFGLLDIFKKNNDEVTFANGKYKVKKVDRKTHRGTFDYEGKTVDLLIHFYDGKKDYFATDTVLRTLPSYIKAAYSKLKWFVNNKEINRKEGKEMDDFLNVAYPVQVTISVEDKDETHTTINISSRDEKIKNEFYVFFGNSPSDIKTFKYVHKAWKEKKGYGY